MEFHYINQLFDSDDFEDIFKDFNWNLIDLDEFKEDAVREEIVFPILKKLGYSASSENKIIRSKALKHPFYYFGTKPFKVNIIPDYTFQLSKKNYWILDAKRPNENIKEGKNLYQAYSYAMHPEIRCEIYCLCNGREMSIFNVYQLEPQLIFEIKNLKDHWKDLKRYLSPEFVKKPNLRDFSLDLGLFILKIGDEQDILQPLEFEIKDINDIIKIEDDLYCINDVFQIKGIGNQEFLATFDFNRKKYDELLSILPDEVRNTINVALESQPFRFREINPKLSPIKIFATVGNVINTNKNESFLPFDVIKFETQ